MGIGAGTVMPHRRLRLLTILSKEPDFHIGRKTGRTSRLPFLYHPQVLQTYELISEDFSSLGN